jgi:hypothetical protein
VMLIRQGSSNPATFRAAPGRSDKLTSANGQWQLLSNEGDLLLFEQSPSTAAHPWSGTNFHARLRAFHPRSLVGYRFALNYEGDSGQQIVGRCNLLPSPNPNGITNCCDQITPGTTNCSASRGLLTRVGVEWIEASGTVTPGPSMELKYEPGGLSSRGEVRLAKILAGALRAEGTTPPVLATFTYDNAAGRSAQLRTVNDPRYAPAGTSTLLTTKLGFEWVATVGADRWQLKTVQESVLNDAGAPALAPVESFTWSNGLVAKHQSRDIAIATTSAPGPSMTWTRNGAAEQSTFDNQGHIVTCQSGHCGVGSRQYAQSATYGAFYSPGPSFVETERQTRMYYMYDSFDRLKATCEVIPGNSGSNCTMTTVGNFDRLSVVGTLRSAHRYYYIGDTGVLRAEAEWLNAGSTTNAESLSFPVDGYGNWFTTTSVALTTCPVLSTTYDDNGKRNSYRVSVYDRNSNDNGTVTGTTLNQSPDATLQGDFALTRTTTAGSVDGANPAGTCQVLGVDRHGRRGRGVTGTATAVSALDRRFDLNGTTWTPVETVFRSYEPLGTTPRLAGLPSQLAIQKTASSTSAAGSVVVWKKCSTGSLYDEDGRLACLEIPHGTDYLRVNETRAASVNGLTRTWTSTDQNGAVLLARFRTSTAMDRVLEEGVVGGNKTRYRYDATKASIAAALTKMEEVLSDGAVFSTTVNTYADCATTPAICSGTDRHVLASSTTSAAGKVTTQRRLSSYDKDGRVARIENENGTTDPRTDLTYTAFDAIEKTVEADGQEETVSVTVHPLDRMTDPPKAAGVI